MKQIIYFMYCKNSIIATAQVPNGITMTAANCQKFIRSILHPQIWQLQWEKIDNSGSMLHDDVHTQLHNQSLIYSLITWGYASPSTLQP